MSEDLYFSLGFELSCSCKTLERKRCHCLCYCSSILRFSFFSSHIEVPFNCLYMSDEQKGQQSSLHPGLTLEEREAAYQAARERIFADSSVGPELEQTGVQRVRPVPVVARRMIAHALGKSSFLSCSPSQKQEVSLLTGRISHGTFVQFGILFCKEGE